MNPEQKHVFPDVNVLVHFPVFDGFNWLSVCSARSVVIHITQPVLKELNKIKDTGNTKSIRRRAATVQKRLKEFLKAPGTAEVGNRVTLRFHSRSALAQQHSGLDNTVADDALISALLTFVQDSGEPAYLMTDDSGLGLMVKADEWNITVVEPSDDLKLPPEADPDQKERDELRKRVAQLEQSRPDLDLSFVSGGKLLKAAPLVSDVPADIQSRLAELKKTHPKLSLPNPKPETSKTGRLTLRELMSQKVSLQDYVLCDPKKIQEYNAELDEFFNEAERVIVHNTTVRQRMIRVEIQVDNSGPAPAKDVLVNMHFPNGLKPLASQDLREVIKRMPRAPQDPTDFSWLRQGFGPGIDPSVYSIAPRNPDAPSLFIEETNSFNVRWHVPKLRQGYASTIDPITVLFATTPFSFPITYTIVADNSHDIVEGTLNVVLT